MSDRILKQCLLIISNARTAAAAKAKMNRKAEEKKRHRESDEYGEEGYGEEEDDESNGEREDEGNDSYGADSYDEGNEKEKLSWAKFVPEVKGILEELVNVVFPRACSVGILERVKDVTHFQSDGSLLDAKRASKKGVFAEDLREFCDVSNFLAFSVNLRFTSTVLFPKHFCCCFLRENLEEYFVNNMDRNI